MQFSLVRALASHQCGPGSNPSVDTICGLSLLLVLSFTPRGCSPGTPVFPSPQKPTFPNSNSTRNQVDKEPLCGCATSKSLFIYLFIIYLSNESLLLVVVVAQVFKKPHIEKGEGRDKDNEEVDNSKHNPTSEFLRYIYRYIDVSKK